MLLTCYKIERNKKQLPFPSTQFSSAMASQEDVALIAACIPYFEAAIIGPIAATIGPYFEARNKVRLIFYKV